MSVEMKRNPVTKRWAATIRAGVGAVRSLKRAICGAQAWRLHGREVLRPLRAPRRRSERRSARAAEWLRSLWAVVFWDGLATGAEERAALPYCSPRNGVATVVAWLAASPVHAKMVLVASAFVYPVYARAVVANAIS